MQFTEHGENADEDQKQNHDLREHALQSKLGEGCPFFDGAGRVVNHLRPEAGQKRAAQAVAAAPTGVRIDYAPHFLLLLTEAVLRAAC